MLHVLNHGFWLAEHVVDGPTVADQHLGEVVQNLLGCVKHLLLSDVWLRANVGNGRVLGAVHALGIANADLVGRGRLREGLLFGFQDVRLVQAGLVAEAGLGARAFELADRDVGIGHLLTINRVAWLQSK